MPELERLMLSELARLDGVVREAYEAFDFKRVYFALFDFMTNDLSAFYFDIRKDRLYCDPASSKARHAALTVIDRLFDCLVRWLAPMIPFTCDEAWAERHGGGHGASGALRRRPRRLARRGAGGEVGEGAPRSAASCSARSKRCAWRKKIGSSLEAKAVLFLSDPELVAALEGVDMAEVAITSGFELKPYGLAPEQRLPARQREGRGGRHRSGGGAEVRALVEIFRGGRLRSGISRRDAPRRRGAARIRRAPTQAAG